MGQQKHSNGSVRYHIADVDQTIIDRLPITTLQSYILKALNISSIWASSFSSFARHLS